MTTDNTIRGFLQSILEEPDNNDLRLIFADYLHDHGEEAWSSFIRRQLSTPFLESISFRPGILPTNWETKVAFDLISLYGLTEVWFRKGCIYLVSGSLENLHQFLPEFVNSWPLERVIVNDIQAFLPSPGMSPENPNYHVYWVDGEVKGGIGCLPTSLFQRLQTTFVPPPMYVETWARDYANHGDANLALSKAILEEAREKANHV